MKALIYSGQTFGGFSCKKRDLTREEIFSLRQSIKKDLALWFTWDRYNEKYRHLVISAEFADVVVFYTDGYIMTEEEFETKVATREDVIFADVMHRI